MEQVFNNNNLKVEKSALSKFERFCSFLLEKNKQFNLTAIRDEAGVYEKHFADSLMGKDYFYKNAKVLEVGSGGGFPSIPLKINNESLDFTLLEATGKKCEFLKQAKELLSFENFTVINGRAEELARDINYRESFDIVTARAVAELNVLAELCLPFLKVGGIAVFYKMKSSDELTRGKNCVALLGGEITEIKDYALYESEGERNIIIIKKVSPSPAKYPREYKKIVKSPLI